MVVKFFVDEDGKALSKKPKGQRVDARPVKRDFIPIPYATDAELISYAGCGYSMILDIESYWNYFLIGFKCIETGKYVAFEDSPDSTIDLQKLNWLIWNFRIITFNGIKYDIPMLFLALRGYKAERMKECNNILIPEDAEWGRHRVNIKNQFGLVIPNGFNHIDIYNVCPLEGSLKKRAARLHARRIQDLPFDPHAILTKEDAEYTKNYCLGSDIPATELLFSELSEQLKLRYDLTSKYQVDLRSKSDAQIAEAVIAAETKRKTGRNIKREEVGAGTSFRYQPPQFLKFQSVGMQECFARIQAMDFVITEEGKLSMPDALKSMEMRIGSTVYKLGKGGLHSKEKCASYKALNGMILADCDVESYYPRLILNSGLYPEAIGPVFLTIFEELVNRRIEAKRNKNKIEADSLKITINGTFGKLGSRWSIMYAPNLLIQVTLTGQLALLMLIERLEAAGIQVVSANTDGIVTYLHESQYETLKAIRDQWCIDANFKMEETRYKALYSRDVNNYIAVKTDDSVKLKGAYSNPWNDPEAKIFRFHKNPMTTVCIEAVEKMLTQGRAVEQSIRECTDITKFVCVKDVKGGAHKNGVYLGKTARWYYAQDERGQIEYVTNGNAVGESQGGKPIQDLPDGLPADIDYAAYVEKANSMLYDIGFYKRPTTASLFE